MKVSTLFTLLTMTLMTSTNARIGTSPHRLSQAEEDDLATAPATAPTASPSPTYSLYVYNYCNSSITIQVDDPGIERKDIESGECGFLGYNLTGSTNYLFIENEFDNDKNEKGRLQGEIGPECILMGSSVPCSDNGDQIPDNTCTITYDMCKSGTIGGW